MQGNPSELRFGTFPVANKFVDEKDGGGVSKLSAENILSHSAEKFVRELSRVSLISGIEKFYA